MRVEEMIEARNAERRRTEERRKEREERRRRSWWYRCWLRLKFGGGLKQACEEGKAALYYADIVEEARFQWGNTLMESTRLEPRVAAEGKEVWERIVKDPGAVRFLLTCRRCGFIHVFVDGHDWTKLYGLRSDSIGGFSDHYRGAWSAPWFHLVRPGIGASRINCRKCGAEEGEPRLRRY